MAGAEIKAVIFDLGGVLVGFRPNVLVKGKFVPKPGQLDWNNKTVPALYNKFARGLISPQQFYSGILPFMRHKISFSEFETFWGNRIFTWRPSVIQFVKQLRKAGYKIGVISDCDAVTYPAIMKRYNLLPFIDAAATSFEVHKRKYEKDLFSALLRNLKEKPSNCIFIDDLQRYVKMGKLLGLNAVQFKNLQQLRRNLLGFGVRIPTTKGKNIARTGRRPCKKQNRFARRRRFK